MNTTNTFGPLAGGLFLAAGEAFRQGQYVVGTWIALGCIACAWVAYRAATATITPSVDSRLDAIREDIAALTAAQASVGAAAAAATADVAARIQAVMSFLQATQTYTSAPRIGANGRPASPLKHPLRQGP